MSRQVHEHDCNPLVVWEALECCCECLTLQPLHHFVEYVGPALRRFTDAFEWLLDDSATASAPLGSGQI
jgi:hypothetical protein